MKSLSSIKALLIDLSGTVHVEDTVIAGAVEAIRRLKNSPLKVRFATNTTKESQKFLLNRLQSMGFNIEKDEIFTSLSFARDLVVEKKLKPYLFLEDSAMEEFKNYVDINIESEYADSVVIGLVPHRFNYDHLNTAFKILHRGGSLIAVDKGRYYKRKDGLALGSGAFVTALEYATDNKALVVGKPEATFFLSAIKPFNCKPQEVGMIGDDARDDIGGAQNIGITGMLVKSGKYRPGDEDKINPKPDFVFETVVEAINAVLAATS